MALLLLLDLLDGQGGLVGEGGQDPALGLPEAGGAGPPATTTSAPTTVSPLRMGTVRARPGSRSAPTGPRSCTAVEPPPAPTKRSSRSPGTLPATAARRTPSPAGSTIAQPARSNSERTVLTTPRRVSSRLPWATRLVDRSNSMRVSRSRRSAWARRRSLEATSRLTTAATSR